MLQLARRVAAGEQRSAPARILADARPASVPKEARAGAAAWAPWAWRAQDAEVLSVHARRAAVDILPRVRFYVLGVGLAHAVEDALGFVRAPRCHQHTVQGANPELQTACCCRPHATWHNVA